MAEHGIPIYIFKVKSIWGTVDVKSRDKERTAQIFSILCQGNKLPRYNFKLEYIACFGLWTKLLLVYDFFLSRIRIQRQKIYRNTMVGFLDVDLFCRAVNIGKFFEYVDSLMKIK